MTGRPTFAALLAARQSPPKTEIILSNTVESNYETKHLLGYGFNVLRGDIVSSALQPFEPKRTLSTIEDVAITSVTDSSDMQTTLSVSVKGDYTLDGVDIGVSAKFINDVSASAMSLSFVAEYWSDDSGYSLAQAEDYKLTTDAAEYFAEHGEDKFQHKYGQYFIAGHRHGARFYAIYRCEGTDFSSFQSFKAMVTASMPELFNAEGAASFTQLAATSEVKVQITYHMVGRPTDISPPKIDKLTPETILVLFNWFRENHRSEPVETLFMSYSNVMSEYSNKITVRSDLVTLLRLIYANYWLIKFLYRSLPEYYHSAERHACERLIAEIENKHSQFMSDGQLVDEYYGKTENMIHDLQRIFEREAQYYQIQKMLSSIPEPEKGTEVHEGRINLRSYGMTVFDSETMEDIVIEEVFKGGAAQFVPGWVEKTYEWENGDLLILGWRVKSESDDNGYWVKKSEGQATLSHELRLYFCSNLWTAMNYRVHVYAIPNDLFRFGALTMRPGEQQTQVSAA